MSTQHEEFLERLKASEHARFVWAQVEHAKGRTIEIPPTKYAPTAAEAPFYVDRGDLIWVVRRRFEVKHLGITFSGPDDWPYPVMLVSNVASVDRAEDVLAYIAISHDYACGAIAKCDTRKYWHVVETFAKNTGNVEKNYACPMELVTFEAIPPEFR
jgi:hypothetical protein